MFGSQDGGSRGDVAVECSHSNIRAVIGKAIWDGVILILVGGIRVAIHLGALAD